MACVGGSVWVVWRGGVIGDLLLPVEGVAPVAVQVVGLAHLEPTVGPVRTKLSSLTLGTKQA